MFNHSSIINGNALFVTATRNHQPNWKEVKFIWQVAKTTSTIDRIPVRQHIVNKDSSSWLSLNIFSFIRIGPLIYLIPCFHSKEVSHCVGVLLWMKWKPIRKKNQRIKWKEMKRFVFQSWVSFNFMKLKFISSAFPVHKIRKYELHLVDSGEFHHYSIEKKKKTKPGKALSQKIVFIFLWWISTENQNYIKWML